MLQVQHKDWKLRIRWKQSGSRQKAIALFQQGLPGFKREWSLQIGPSWCIWSKNKNFKMAQNSQPPPGPNRQVVFVALQNFRPIAEVFEAKEKQP